jgi:predicted nucleic acid-binding Zn finger protein
VENAVAGGSIKRLLFTPSGRTLWLVVGRDNEHWADPELKFCTCKDYYFKALSGGSECYHLKSVQKAIEDSRHNTTEFGDDEYVQVLQAIVQDQWDMLCRS